MALARTSRCCDSIIMHTSALEFEIPIAVSVEISDDTIAVDLSDGRSIFVPVGWFPRLDTPPRKRENIGGSLATDKESTGGTLMKICNYSGGALKIA